MKNIDELYKLRHTAEHVLHQAVKDLYPQIQPTMGPATEDGFYFDFDNTPSGEDPVIITEKDFPKIQKRMKELINKNLPILKDEISVKQAREMFADNLYKLEWIDEAEKRGDKISIYWTGKPGEKDSMVDLCAGPHAKSTGEIKAFKLLSVAGAYWHGDEKNKMLTRIYGTAFPSKDELTAYLSQQEEAKKRDHKKLGPQLELFFFHKTAPGMPYWLPKGVILYNELLQFWREEHSKRGYQETVSPVLNKKELYITSGHYDHYWKNMFVADMGEDEIYGVKAMNCPNAMTFFGFKTRSYRDLPLRLSDTDTLHRYELSGVLNGLFRVREFRQDDAHIFVHESQIESEFRELFNIVERFYSVFDLSYSFRLGKRPEKFMGDPKVWDSAEKTLENILKTSGKKYVVVEGEGAFYGPKIDILMKDSLGREWQMGTLQLDFHQPKRFNLTFTNDQGEQETPITIHRVVYGSLERFIGILIEHFEGNFPLWLTPTQVKIIPIAKRHNEYAQHVASQLSKERIRVEMDDKSESMQKKIRNAQKEKVYYMIIIGDQEIEKKQINVRRRSGETEDIKVDEFISQTKKIISDRSNV